MLRPSRRGIGSFKPIPEATEKCPGISLFLQLVLVLWLHSMAATEQFIWAESFFGLKMPFFEYSFEPLDPNKLKKRKNFGPFSGSLKFVYRGPVSWRKLLGRSKISPIYLLDFIYNLTVIGDLLFQTFRRLSFSQKGRSRSSLTTKTQ